MIEHTEINGRTATVSYLDMGFNLVPAASAKLLKVIFDDGELAFLVPKEVEKFDPSQPRAEDGKWTDGGGSMDLSVEEVVAIQHYTGMGYVDINAGLRGSSPVVPVDRIAVLDGAIAKNLLSEPTIVYRGLTNAAYRELKDGQIWVDRGFLSASLSRGEAAKFSEFGGRVIKMHLPRGAKALFLRPLSRGGEKEVLVARGSRFRVAGSGLSASLELLL